MCEVSRGIGMPFLIFKVRGLVSVLLALQLPSYVMHELASFCGLVQASCLMTMQSGSDGIADVQWSPDNGTVFAVATAGGQMQLWDLESSILSPTATFAFPGKFSP